MPPTVHAARARRRVVGDEAVLFVLLRRVFPPMIGLMAWMMSQKDLVLPLRFAVSLGNRLFY